MSVSLCIPSVLYAKDGDELLLALSSKTSQKTDVHDADVLESVFSMLDTATKQPIFALDVKGISTFYSSSHAGIDIRANKLSPIYAPKDGVVVETGNQPGGYGNFVILSHETDAGLVYSLYAHMHKSEILVGKIVKKGDVIGQVGMSGHTTGPHVHFETRKCAQGQAYFECTSFDPLKFL